MAKKLKVGIDINEILRARCLTFNKFYAQEFGETDIPEQFYVYDFFKDYKWEDKIEVSKELKEPEDMPENISPIDYQIDERLGEAPADAFLFKLAEKKLVTAREQYNRFMYEDYVFEIHATSPIMYKGMDLDVNNFYIKYYDSAEFTLYSVENRFSIPSTLFFLSKMTARFKNIKFVDKAIDMWDNSDILITTDPSLLELGTPWGKKLIKLKRPYNENLNNVSLDALHLNDLTTSKEFEKIIKYKK